MKKNTEPTAGTPACRLMELFGSRWALQVLLTLEEAGGAVRYGVLRRRIPGAISERMLAATLDELERAGLVGRTVWPEVPPRVEYALTPKTAGLLPILHRLRAWAEENG